MEKNSKQNQKLFFKVIKILQNGKKKYKANKKGKVLREEKEIVDTWKEYFVELLNVERERQTRYDEEDDVQEQKKEMRDNNNN